MAPITVKACEKFEGIPEPICCTTSDRRETDISRIVMILANLPYANLLLCGSTEVSLDEHCDACFRMLILRAKGPLNFINPSLYRLHEVFTTVDLLVPNYVNQV